MPLVTVESIKNLKDRRFYFIAPRVCYWYQCNFHSNESTVLENLNNTWKLPMDMIRSYFSISRVRHLPLL